MFLAHLLHGLIAQQAPGGAPPGMGCGGAVIPILFIIPIFYFLIIRPQQKEQKKHNTLLSNLKKGDEVVTNGGVVGRIHAVTDRICTLEVSRDVRIRVLKQQIAGLYQEPDESTDGDGDKK